MQIQDPGLRLCCVKDSVVIERVHLMCIFQNPAKGFSRVGPDGASALRQPADLPPQRFQGAPEVQFQAQYRFASLDGGLEPLLAPEQHHSNNASAQLQCNLQTMQMQGHVVSDLRRTLSHCG